MVVCRAKLKALGETGLKWADVSEFTMNMRIIYPERHHIVYVYPMHYFCLLQMLMLCSSKCIEALLKIMYYDAIAA